MGKIRLCPVWLRVKRASSVFEKADSILQPGTRINPPLPRPGTTLSCPLWLYPVASAMEGSPDPLSNSRSREVYSQGLYPANETRIERAFYFIDHRGQERAVFLTLTTPCFQLERGPLCGKVRELGARRSGCSFLL